MIHIKKFNEYTLNESNSPFDNPKQFIKDTLKDDHIDVSNQNLTIDGKKITLLYSDYVETDDYESFDLDELNNSLLTELAVEVEQWDAENYKTYKRADIE